MRILATNEIQAIFGGESYDVYYDYVDSHHYSNDYGYYGYGGEDKKISQEGQYFICGSLALMMVLTGVKSII